MVMFYLNGVTRGGHNFYVLFLCVLDFLFGTYFKNQFNCVIIYIQCKPHILLYSMSFGKSIYPCNQHPNQDIKHSIPSP